MNTRLPVPFKGLMPISIRRVGLEMLRGDNFLETDKEWAKRITPLLALTRRNVVMALPAISPYLTHSLWYAILEQLCLGGKIGKRQLLLLYRLQIEGVRRAQPLIFLKDLHGLIYDDARIFTNKEIIKLASDTVTISSEDIEFLMGNRDLRDLLPVPLLKAWVSGDAKNLNMLNRARVAKCLSTKRGECMDMETLCDSLRMAAEFSPSSGAVQIFFNLLYSHKDIRSKQGRDKARKTLFDALCKMVLPLSRGRSIDFHEGQRLLGWYLTNPLIDQADKSWMETELKIHTDAVAKFYGNFIKNAKEDSPTAIED